MMLLGASPKVITEVAAKALEFWEQQREWEAGLSRNETERKQAEMAELQERLHRCDAHRQQVIKQLEEGKQHLAGPQITSKVNIHRVSTSLPFSFVPLSGADRQ